MEQKKIMLALMLREQVKVVISSHLHQYGGHLYRMLRGGPMGLTLTTVLSRALTKKFCKKFKEALDKLKLKLYLKRRLRSRRNEKNLSFGDHLTRRQKTLPGLVSAQCINHYTKGSRKKSLMKSCHNLGLASDQTEHSRL